MVPGDSFLQVCGVTHLGKQVFSFMRLPDINLVGVPRLPKRRIHIIGCLPGPDIVRALFFQVHFTVVKLLAKGQLNMTGTIALVVVSVTGSQFDFSKLSCLAISDMSLPLGHSSIVMTWVVWAVSLKTQCPQQRRWSDSGD